MTEIKTCRQINEERVTTWESGTPRHLYRSPNNRITFIREQAKWESEYDGIGRAASYGQAGISDSDLDATELATDIVEMFMPQFSQFEMEYIVSAMQAELERWTKRREKAITLHVDTYGKN